MKWNRPNANTRDASAAAYPLVSLSTLGPQCLRTFFLFCALLVSSQASAQSSSLYGDPRGRVGLTVADTSWTFEKPPEPRKFKLNDQVTILVKENTQVSSDGEMDRRKQADGMMTLTDWIVFDKFAVIPDPQSHGNPTVGGAMSNKLRSQANLQTRDSMSFKIAVRVADIRPNGYLVLEGVRSIHNNNETWEQCLTGVVRPEDVLPNNTVQSENVGELRIFKRESGHVRDGYRRGWLLKILDKYQPF